MILNIPPLALLTTPYQRGLKTLYSLIKYSICKIPPIFLCKTTLFLLLINFNISSPVLAETKNYQIEIICFEQADKKAGSEETWPKNPGKPNITQARVIQPITPAQFELKDTVAHLRRNGHRVILHTAWQQTIGERNQSYAVHLQGGKQYGDTMTSGAYEIEGTIRASISRFLHVDSDLVFLKSVNIINQTENNMIKINSSESGSILQPFRQKQSTKMRSNELHYIDNPIFGTIILVHPIAN